MIDPQNLLGGLLNTALSSGLKTGKMNKHAGGLGGLLDPSKAAMGMGLIGLAIGAFEHFTQQGGPAAGQNASSPSGPPPLPGAPGAMPPPLPTPRHEGAMPPPPPALSQSSTSSSSQEEEAYLLIRAMIAAANADYSVDDTERAAILARIEEAGLNEQERNYILSELDHPLGLVELTNQVKTPEMAGQVYAVSLIATQADTEVERNYLRSLAKRLKLEASTVTRWHQNLGIDTF